MYTTDTSQLLALFVTVIVNLFLERQKNAVRYARHCILMYIRPMKIGPRDVADKFCTFTPPEE